MTPIVSAAQLAQITKGTKLTFVPKNDNWKKYLPDLPRLTYYMFEVVEDPFADPDDLKSHIMTLSLNAHIGYGQMKIKASELLDGNWGLGH